MLCQLSSVCGAIDVVHMLVFMSAMYLAARHAAAALDAQGVSGVGWTRGETLGISRRANAQHRTAARRSAWRKGESAISCWRSQQRSAEHAIPPTRGYRPD